MCSCNLGTRMSDRIDKKLTAFEGLRLPIFFPPADLLNFKTVETPIVIVIIIQVNDVLMDRINSPFMGVKSIYENPFFTIPYEKQYSFCIVSSGLITAKIYSPLSVRNFSFQFW